jgi:hypothetical protein
MVASADGWANCAGPECFSGPAIPASEARASLAMTSKWRTPFCNTHEQDYGLKIVGGNATTAAVESVMLRFG